MMMFLVLLKTDNERGSAVVACTAIRPDPLFPSKFILDNVQAVSWPFHGRFLEVRQWSVEKDVVLNWMVGPLRESPTVTTGMLKGETQEVPWPPQSTPAGDLGSRETIQALAKENPEPTPKPQEAPAPPPAAPAAVPIPPIRGITINGR